MNHVCERGQGEAEVCIVNGKDGQIGEERNGLAALTAKLIATGEYLISPSNFSH
jgi:hypothetical protein